ncbi:MAG TPA: hypothetical protein VGZ52_11115 [Acidimicrobiales bacterium]|nr:hypothetical protein [Acidimicrobiales bacterium]
MSRLSGSGIGVDVPSGWEGRIYAKPSDPGLHPTGAQSMNPNAVLHVASFPLPRGAGDYGGGAVEQMANTDLLVILMEHGAAAVGTALFAPAGMPRLTKDDVSPNCLQRLIEGQGGAQKFFTENGRAFCLYVVFGSHLRRARTLPVVNDLLRTVTIT